MNAVFVGLPASGKSTLAHAITGFTPPPGTGHQIQRSIVKVPDPRLPVLAKMYNPKKVTEATIEYIDVPGFSLADPKGLEDLRRFLPDIRQADLLVAVIRAFQNPAVPSYRNRVDAAADLAELREELVYADLETISNRLERVEKALKKPSKTHDQEKREQGVLAHCKSALENSTPLSAVLPNPEEQRLVASFGLLTLKPLVAVFNVDESRAAEPDPPAPAHCVHALNLCALTEFDISQLEPSERVAFLADLGVGEPARDRLVRHCYQALGLLSFLTVGEDEVRAWTVHRGADAVQAADKIHSDIARGFIRAETVTYTDLLAAGDMKNAKAHGKVRQEGKTYVVQDGDVINFKFNV